MNMMKWRYRLEDAYFEILHNAVDLPADAAVPRPARRQNERPPRLLSVTRLAETYKGVEQVIDALGVLRRSIPDIEYHVVGDGRLRPALMARARLRGVESAVHFHGRLSPSELEQAYRSADVFVLPSRKEGFGIVYLEAWKFGLPVICGNVDASPEVVIDGVSGIVVDPDDVEGLARAISRLIANPQERARLAKNGFVQLRKSYTNDIFVRTYLTILGRLIARAAAPTRL